MVKLLALIPALFLMAPTELLACNASAKGTYATKCEKKEARKAEKKAEKKAARSESNKPRLIKSYTR